MALVFFFFFFIGGGGNQLWYNLKVIDKVEHSLVDFFLWIYVHQIIAEIKNNLNGSILKERSMHQSKIDI